MSFTLTVEPGDHLAKIASEHGFADWHTIWDCPENSQLKQTRDPNLLKPGDQVFIPDKQPKTVSAATGSKHSYTLKGKTTRVVLTINDPFGKPLKNAPVTVTVGNKSAVQMTTDGSGGLKIPIDANDVNAKIVTGTSELDLMIGHLDPVDDKNGAIARLRNLGYLDDLDGDIDESGIPTDDALAFAVELFQADNKLPVDGTDLDSITAKLKEIYGC